MKLGKQKKFFIKVVLLFLFMFFLCGITITYLYNKTKVNKEDYIKLLLSDSYGDNFLVNLVEIINRSFSPLNMIKLSEVNNMHFNLSNKENILNPEIYIYSSNQNNSYQKEYNVTPNIYLVTYLLSMKLNSLGKSSVFETNNIYDFSINNNISANESENLFINDAKIKYSSLKYILNINRNNDNKNITTIRINGKKYAKIYLYANKNNISLVSSINKLLNEKYEGISKIYFDESSNDFINIDFGGYENSMSEVVNSIEVFSYTFKEAIS